MGGSLREYGIENEDKIIMGNVYHQMVITMIKLHKMIPGMPSEDSEQGHVPRVVLFQIKILLSNIN